MLHGRRPQHRQAADLGAGGEVALEDAEGAAHAGGCGLVLRQRAAGDAQAGERQGHVPVVGAEVGFLDGEALLQERLARLPRVQLAVRERQVVQRGCGPDVPLAEVLLVDRQGLHQQAPLGHGVPPLAVGHGEVAEGGREPGIVGEAWELALYLEALLQQRALHVVVPQLPVAQRQVVQRRAQRAARLLLVQPRRQHLLQERLLLPHVAEPSMQVRQACQRRVRVLVAESVQLLLHRQALLQKTLTEADVPELAVRV
mmetsp:Transcript_73209/g.214598  ORF Transcript_73209/g.214598 Transcript_73209/m.214598 type:complete len:257 (+) Transcript_73209:446-1216(+)